MGWCLTTTWNAYFSLFKDNLCGGQVSSFGNFASSSANNVCDHERVIYLSWCGIRVTCPDNKKSKRQVEMFLSSLIMRISDSHFSSENWKLTRIFFFIQSAYLNGVPAAIFCKETSPSDKELLNTLPLMESYALLNLCFSDGIKALLLNIWCPCKFDLFPNLSDKSRSR